MRLLRTIEITALLLFLSLNVNAETIKLKQEAFSMSENPVIIMKTNQGTIEIKLFPKIAPKTCENFIRLAEQGYYDGIIFHRVIKNFMIQGGDPTGTGRGGTSIWGEPFEDEVSKDVKFDKPGLLAMANAGPGTNGSQFFITTIKTPWLNMRHTIFGEVVKGYEVVQKIENVKKGPGDKPIEEQKILKMYLKKTEKEQKTEKKKIK